MNLVLRSSSMLALALVVTLAGCSGKKTTSSVEEDGAPTIPEAVNADSNAATGDSDSGMAMGLQTINFAYDDFKLDPESKTKLAANAQILKDNGNAKIQIEGHCDQRGGIQYNIALGEKRAKAVKRYLEDQGVKGSRIETISFGKERPLDPSSSDQAYAKNRRANFVVTSK